MLKVLFRDKNVIFDNNPSGDLKLYRKSRNAYSHLSLIFNGDCFNWGDLMAIERNLKGDYLGVIKREKIIKLRCDLVYLLCFLSQVFWIYPLKNKSIESSEISSKKKDDDPHFFTDYMAGQLHLVQKCPYCDKDVNKGMDKSVLVPKIEIEINQKDEKLDKIYSIKQEINKTKIFCNLECFIKYIRDNTLKEISTEIINSF